MNRLEMGHFRWAMDDSEWNLGRESNVWRDYDLND